MMYSKSRTRNTLNGIYKNSYNEETLYWYINQYYNDLTFIKDYLSDDLV